MAFSSNKVFYWARLKNLNHKFVKISWSTSLLINFDHFDLDPGYKEMLKVSYKYANYCQRFIITWLCPISMMVTFLWKQGEARNRYLFLQRKFIIDGWKCLKYASEYAIQSSFTCSKLTIETLIAGWVM